MLLSDIKEIIHPELFSVLGNENIHELRPAQEKSVSAGLLQGKNLLICTPTASGKTLVAEFAIMNSILNGVGKAIYIVPLKALATEKYKEFKRKYSHLSSMVISIGDRDSADTFLSKYDIIITTSEKLDSLIRHKAPWLKDVKVVVVDEIHLINDAGRGPTVEILITLLRQLLKNVQVIGLSATIGNPKELAKWLDAKLIEDDWRPVALHKGIYLDGEVEFY